MNYSYKNKAFKQPFYFDVKSTSLLKECLAKNIKFLGGVSKMLKPLFLVKILN